MHPHMKSAFDRDMYFGTHSRHLFFASSWLSHLIEKNYDWPLAVADMILFLKEKNCSADHIEGEVEKARLLIAPWLIESHRVEGEVHDA